MDPVSQNVTTSDTQSGALMRYTFCLWTARALRFGAAGLFVVCLFLIVRACLFEFAPRLMGSTEWFPGVFVGAMILALFVLLPAWALYSFSSSWERSIKARRELAATPQANAGSDALLPSSRP